MSKVVLTLLCAASAFAASPVSFNVPQRDVFTGGSPTWIASGDFNGDGIPDLIGPNGYPNYVTVSLGNGDGTFGTPINTTVSGQANYVAVGDFNNDGKLDAIVTNLPGDIHLPPGISVLLGNGDGTFTEGFDYLFVALTSLGPPTVADLNRDGKPDLILPGLTAGRVIVMLGNGDGTFQRPASYISGTNSTMARVADVNGDRIPDILVANARGVAVLLGKGDGTFGPPIYSVGVSSATSLAVGDLNGDGKLDVVLSVSGIAVLLGNGDGTFKAPVEYGAGKEPQSVALVDLTKDGKLDVVTADFGSNTLSVLLGNGDGTLKTASHYPFSGSPTGLVLADFNGDGAVDAATASSVIYSFSVLIGNGNGTFELPPVYPVSAGAEPVSIAKADFNGDRGLDVITANGSSQNLSLLLGNGHGVLQSVITIPLPGLQPSYVVTSDFNRDGKADVAVLSEATGSVGVLLGNGNASFQSPAVFAAGTSPNFLAAGDVNGDGKPDLIATDSATGTVLVLLGNGDGTFQTAKSFATGSGPTCVAIGDFNADGKPDLITGSSTTDLMVDLTLLLGNGDGTFQKGVNISIGARPTFIALADVNSDGKLDVISSASFDFASSVAVTLGNGDGTFQPTSFYRVPGSLESLAIVDLNGDGRLDIVGNSEYSSVTVLMGNGDGTFQPAVDFASNSASHPAYLITGDFNGDGKPDVATTGLDGVSILTNTTP